MAHLARAVGWMSVGFGIFDFLLANRLAKGVGLRDEGSVFRRAAAREVCTGVAALRMPTRKAPIVARLAGDVSDIAILTNTARRPKNGQRRAAWVGVGIVAAVTLIDAIALAEIVRRRAPRSA